MLDRAGSNVAPVWRQSDNNVSKRLGVGPPLYPAGGQKGNRLNLSDTWGWWYTPGLPIANGGQEKPLRLASKPPRRFPCASQVSGHHVVSYRYRGDINDLAKQYHVSIRQRADEDNSNNRLTMPTPRDINSNKRLICFWAGPIKLRSLPWKRWWRESFWESSSQSHSFSSIGRLRPTPPSTKQTFNWALRIEVSTQDPEDWTKV